MTAILATIVFGFIALIGVGGICGVVTGLSEDGETEDFVSGFVILAIAIVFAGLAAKAFGL